MTNCLVLVARVDDDLLGIVVLQHVAGERVAERAGASGYEDGFVIEHVQFLSMLLFSRCVQCKTRRDASHWWQCLETADISQIHMFFLAYAHSRGRSNPIERTCPLDLRQSLKLVFTSLEDRPFLLSRERWGSKMEILQTACIFAYCQTLRIGTSLRWPFFGPILPLFGVGGDLPSTAASRLQRANASFGTPSSSDADSACAHLHSFSSFSWSSLFAKFLKSLAPSIFRSFIPPI